MQIIDISKNILLRKKQKQKKAKLATLVAHYIGVNRFLYSYSLL